MPFTVEDMRRRVAASGAKVGAAEEEEVGGELVAVFFTSLVTWGAAAMHAVAAVAKTAVQKKAAAKAAAAVAACAYAARADGLAVAALL